MQQHAGELVGKGGSPLAAGHGVQLDMELRVQVEGACQLADALAGALESSQSYKENQGRWYPSQASPGGNQDESWDSSGPVRGALWSLSLLCMELK